MNKILNLECDARHAESCSRKLALAIEKNTWVQLLPKQGEQKVIPNNLIPRGGGVVISSGGSCGGPHQCLHPSTNLDQSAIATGHWLQKQGFNPKDSVIFNPLPLSHVSGLMPWWRSRLWGAEHNWLTPSLMRNPIALNKSCQSLFKKKIGPLLISLVPTQIQRLLSHPEGLSWLQAFDVIWVGGSTLSEKLAEQARNKNIHLAPCYGATETAAMITVLDPTAFLEGKTGCGNPLIDVDLRLNQSGALEVKTERIASAILKNGSLKSIIDSNGWWQSGDLAKLNLENNLYQLEIIGRLDTAIHSGGETVFPENLESKLLGTAKTIGLPVQFLVFLPVHDNEWGQRLVTLVKWESDLTVNEHQEQIKKLQCITNNWHPAERPLAWYKCNELAPNEAGKFERSKWEDWLKENH